MPSHERFWFEQEAVQLDGLETTHVPALQRKVAVPVPVGVEDVTVLLNPAGTAAIVPEQLEPHDTVWVAQGGNGAVDAFGVVHTLFTHDAIEPAAVAA